MRYCYVHSRAVFLMQHALAYINYNKMENLYLARLSRSVRDSLRREHNCIARATHHLKLKKRTMWRKQAHYSKIVYSMCYCTHNEFTWERVNRKRFSPPHVLFIVASEDVFLCYCRGVSKLYLWENAFAFRNTF